MRYLLDTNICIYYLKGMFNLSEKIETIGMNQCAISEITLAELIYGAQNSQQVAHNMMIVKEFSQQLTVLPIINVLEIYGQEKTRLKRIGQMISDFDFLIGATAIANGLTMVTRNINEFQRLAGIEMDNWIDS